MTDDQFKALQGQLNSISRAIATLQSDVSTAISNQQMLGIDQDAMQKDVDQIKRNLKKLLPD